MSLMKKITDEHFKWTLFDGTDARSDDILMTLEGNPEHGCYIAETNLESELYVRHVQQIRIIEQGKPMPPAFRMLPKIIVHWNFTKGGVD